MKCKTVTKKILTFLDKDLEQKEIFQIQDHLNSCEACSKQVNIISDFYNPDEKNVAKPVPPPYIWERLYLKISSQEKTFNPFSGFLKKSPVYAFNFGIVFIFISSILLGIYLGSYPNNSAAQTNIEPAVQTVSENFVKDSFIDSFDDFPPESVGKITLTMEME